MFRRTCQICGTEFESPSNRAKYCVYCRDKAQAMRNKAYKENKLAGLSVTLGSKQICQICGKTYTVVSGSQKCCKDCSKKQTNARKQQPTAQYIKEKYDYVRFHVPKGEGDKIKVYAQEHSMTVKDLMLAALEEYQEKHNSDNSNKQSSCYTYFMIEGDFNPDTISELIGFSPEKSWKIGDKRKNGTIYDFSLWQFGTCDEYDICVENQMLKTITPLLSKINILKEIKQKYDVDFYLEVVPTIVSSECTPSLAPSMEVIKFCYETNTRIDIDLYIDD